jgi:hypothetical protein
MCETLDFQCYLSSKRKKKKYLQKGAFKCVKLGTSNVISREAKEQTKRRQKEHLTV